MYRVITTTLFVLPLVAALGAGGALADGGNQAGPAVGIGISTLGITGELSYKVIGNFVVRVNGNWASADHKPKISNADVAGGLRIAGAGLIGDWHPFENGFRFSGGARWHQAQFTGDVSGQSVTLNGTTYTAAQYGKLHGEVEPGSRIAPYFGIGWDSTHFSNGGLSLGFEVGAMYLGTPTAKLTASNAAAVPGLQANANAEAKKLRDDFGKFGEFWPVVALTAKYRF
jgi:hypothetical protein